MREVENSIHQFLISNYLAGVDHFFLYDVHVAESSTRVSSLVQQFAPLVTVSSSLSMDDFKRMINWTISDAPQSRINRQEWMYLHCVLKFGARTRWMMSINVDEYLKAKRPLEMHSATAPFVHRAFMHEFLTQIERSTPAQAGRWATVLTNGRVFPPRPSTNVLSAKYPTTCGYRERFERPTGAGDMYSAKTAFQPGLLDTRRYVGRGIFFVNGVKQSVEQTRRAKEVYFKRPYDAFDVPVDTHATRWYIVHYWARSVGDYLVKAERGRGDGQRRSFVDELLRREQMCRPNGSEYVSLIAQRRHTVVRLVLRKVTGYVKAQRTAHETVSEIKKQFYWIQLWATYLGDWAI